ncbi:UDP-N-acetylmuramoyl-L-alanyl-D-glutamate--2,6-diaminopimelate ligase [Alkalihalobacterium chitinilyticum]|uniref:UDP-N-acetylmuramoyl-L-alanyl-D-glutamate--2, 6-diaminopimelate ligase n=1 Tax=Alkalihalobacterium chitinilyticum TaxID=2980103 RepID=A0ABT5VDN6_9BACI|nr:UDP-N-acetylmuramoyl-L-alanyl-D-glutamate--2,6-diaminopimelate ligase [Alkalihalobacterium chitinilyticum]MDE5413573.1 UDP-N-acetylmuramoyl-L-alanyl-D-glutamate--2,6-diaminopimelate ligase [Alkalihalobacterium chitinilyticum]
MKLNSLLQPIESDLLTDDIPDISISGIHFHSKKIKQNFVFVAISGNEADGHEYIEDAIKAGAVAILGEKDKTELSVPYIRVKNSRNLLPKLAQRFFDTGTKKHTIIGITGTNGKTTTSYMLRHILESAGMRCSLIGTVNNIINGELLPPSNTTPDPITLHELMYKSMDEVFIIEVSSHGIDQGRVNGIPFDYVLFTNLSHDHLDYHGTIYNYFEVKAQLFEQLNHEGEAIVSNYCDWSRRLIDRLTTAQKNVFSVGHEESDHMNLNNVNVEFSTEFNLKQAEQELRVTLPLSGIHNAQNASLSFFTARRLGIPAHQAVQALNDFPGVPGRFETYTHPSGATCVIDYAHTPDGLNHCLQTINKQGAKRVFHIFGFRGNGDPSKRKEMIEISSKFSDHYILTLDDLNGMDAKEMVQELHRLQELYGSEQGTVIEDRTVAIQLILQQAQEGDWVIITGKGPESYKQAFQYPTSTDRDTVLYNMATYGA